MRVGMGYDVHPLVANRRLVLGGVEIPHPVGLLGHSDADVLLHAIMDALLGSIAAGDIGQHFPNTDPRFAGASSVDLLAQVGTILAVAGYSIINIDATLLAEEPKISPHLMAMRTQIAGALCIMIEQVSIKATTNETLGFVGRQEGLAAMAIAGVVRSTESEEPENGPERLPHATH